MNFIRGPDREKDIGDCIRFFPMNVSHDILASKRILAPLLTGRFEWNKNCHFCTVLTKLEYKFRAWTSRQTIQQKYLINHYPCLYILFFIFFEICNVVFIEVRALTGFLHPDPQLWPKNYFIRLHMFSRIE